MFKVKVKLVNAFRRKFGTKLTREDLIGYRNILKLLYHPESESPIKSTFAHNYIIKVNSLHLDLIISTTKAEIVNTLQIYPLSLNMKVYERAVSKINQEIDRQYTYTEQDIRCRKQTILDVVYSQIKW